MKQRWIFGVIGTLITAFFLSCTGFFELEEEGIIDLADENKPTTSTTMIRFDNSRNNYAVNIYSVYTRDNLTARAETRALSLARSWFFTDDAFTFYLTYEFKLMGISVPYIPPSKYENAYISYAIPKDRTTTIPIPELKDKIPTDIPFLDEAFIYISNNNPSAIRLLSGNTPLQPVGRDSAYVNNGETAIYKINPSTPTHLFKILAGTKEKSLDTINIFLASYLYEVSFGSDDSVTHSNPTLLTLSILTNN